MASPLTKADVKRIARLAHLELNDDEQALFAQQLARILEYAERLKNVDTTGVAVTWYPGAESEPLRPDVPHHSLATDDALANAPAAGPRDLFRVPKVIG